MDPIVSLILGLVAGGACAALLLSQWVSKAKQKAALAASKEKNLVSDRLQLEEEKERLRSLRAEMQSASEEARRRAAALQQSEADFQRRIISYRELQEENAILKRDLQNIDVNMNKLQLDGEARQQRQAEIDVRSTALAKRYLAENVKATVAAVGPSNYATCKNRLVDAIQRVRDIGFAVTEAEEAALIADLKAEFEKAVRAEFERQEQARIKAQIREEERLKREVERELKQLERERLAVQAALDQALAEAQGQHTAEVQRLQARLAEAEAKAQRTMSMAQQTKAGNVYVISNIGSMGDGVFKIGMTRHLEPMDRVRELGDASVPFPFDVHMMIRCDDAPSLENALHRAFHRHRLNKINPRKEFFRTTIDEIARIVREHRGEIEYEADAPALEYRQSLTISDADADFVEQVYESAGMEGDGEDVEE